MTVNLKTLDFAISSLKDGAYAKATFLNEKEELIHQGRVNIDPLDPNNVSIGTNMISILRFSNGNIAGTLTEVEEIDRPTPHEPPLKSFAFLNTGYIAQRVDDLDLAWIELGEDDWQWRSWEDIYPKIVHLWLPTDEIEPNYFRAV